MWEEDEKRRKSGFQDEDGDEDLNRKSVHRDGYAKLATHARDSGSRGSRTRCRANGGSLSSRDTATGMQCGLCAVVAGLFRRAMCIAGSRRGSGESCYQELAMDVQERRHSQTEHVETELMKASEIAERVKNVIQMEEVRD